MATRKYSSSHLLEGYVHKFRFDSHDGSAVRIGTVARTVVDRGARLLRVVAVASAIAILAAVGSWFASH